jgi:hypothetical protein
MNSSVGGAESGGAAAVYLHERTTGLFQCPSCGWYTRTFQADGRCLDCNQGWVECPVHVRLEHAGSDHRRVTAEQVVTALRDRHSGGGQGR